MELSGTSFVAPAPRRRGPRSRAAVAAAALAGLLVLPSCGSNPAATTFTREAVNVATVDPFTPSVGTDQAGVVPPAHVTGPYSGTTPGLYAGSSSGAACDPAALVEFLGADSAKAAAWADVLGIHDVDIGPLVARLTPAVLRADTAVTNHAFTDGEAAGVPTVLQAGTAVFVDERGVPIVKCGSGNPLTATSMNDPTYTGASWPGFVPEAVTSVTPAPVPVLSLVIADPTGVGVRRPIGTSGAADAPYIPGVGDPTTGGDAASTVTPTSPGGDAGRADAPGVGDRDVDYPLDSPPVVSTIYVATAGSPGDGEFVSDDCRRAAIFVAGFTVTVRVDDVGGARSAVTIEGDGPERDTVAIGSPRPGGDMTDVLSVTGTFSPGGIRIYDTSTHEGVFTARWGGSLGTARPRPTQFPLTIRQTWQRDPDFVPWLASSGGPETYSCIVDVVAVRQG